MYDCQKSYSRIFAKFWPEKYDFDLPRIFHLKKKAKIGEIIIPSETYHKKLAIWILFLWNLANLGHFFHKKSFV
jgi:hypothetical protein